MTSPAPLSPVEHKIGSETIRYTPSGCPSCGCGHVSKLVIEKHGSEFGQTLMTLDGAMARSVWAMVQAWAAPRPRGGTFVLPAPVRSTTPYYNDVAPLTVGPVISQPHEVTVDTSFPHARSLTSTDEGPE